MLFYSEFGNIPENFRRWRKANSKAIAKHQFFKQTQEEVDDDLGIYALNLQIL